MNDIPLQTRAGETPNRVEQALRTCLLTGELPPDAFQRLLQAVRIQRFEAGRLIFQQGDLADRFYLLLTGEVKIYRLSPEGQEKIIDLIQPGQSFAEAVIFAQQLGFPVHAEAVADSELLAIPAQVYLEGLWQSPQVCMHLLARMSMRLHRQVQEIDRLTLHSASYRLLHLLLEEIPSHLQHAETVRITIPKHIMASRLAISPETLSRLLGKLRRLGLIENHKHAIVLLDVEAVRRFYLDGGRID